MEYSIAHLQPAYGLFIAALLLVSGLVFLLAMLGKPQYRSIKNLVYALFVVCWSVVFIYLVLRVGAMLYGAIGHWLQ